MRLFQATLLVVTSCRVDEADDNRKLRDVNIVIKCTGMRDVIGGKDYLEMDLRATSISPRCTIYERCEKIRNLL